MALRALAAAVSLALLAFSSTGAHGHGVGFGVVPEPAVAVRFAYSGGEPMSYAQVEVFGPQSEPDLEFQNGRTDARGVFAFVPDGPGQWRIIADDGTGHRAEMEIDVPDSGPPAPGLAQQAAPETSTPLRALLGLSLIANLALAIALVRGRRPRLR